MKLIQYICYEMIKFYVVVALGIIHKCTVIKFFLKMYFTETRKIWTTFKKESK